MKINHSLIIKQPVNKVFECLSDFSRAGLWSNLITPDSPLSPTGAKPSLGYCYKNQIKLLNRQWKVTYQLIEFEPNRLITSKTTSGWLPAIITYRLEPQANATRLVYLQELELVKFFLPFEMVLQNSLERQIVTDLANLKDWLESGLYTEAII